MLVPKREAMDAETELYWLALALVPGLGHRRGARIVESFEDVRAVFSAPRGDLEAAGLSGAVAQTIASGCTFEEAFSQQERARVVGCQILPLCHPFYPSMLRGVLDAPLLLFALGNVDLLHDVNVAIVGTRRPSTYGKSVAEKLARDLAALQVCVVSGMARGIDTCAHRGVLDAGGKTIAVFGCGIDHIYPAENKALSQEIASKGLIISEFALGASPYPQNFPLRNRVVSGISHGVVVVEGSQYSGSAITARYALEQGREVLAVPGNITSQPSWGPNLLIKQGAALVQDATDILNQLPTQVRVRLYRKMHEAAESRDSAPEVATPITAVDPHHAKVLSQLRVDEGTLMDDLMDRLPFLSSSEIIAALFQLEMDGLVKQDVGQRYTRLWC
ncbi:MAG: DNA-processing protein DprA [Bryobacterales bacterium]|nr:DNA-processing protein DprA [Bryobacterales bacterium]